MQQAARSFKLFKLFNILTDRRLTPDLRAGEIYKYISATWSQKKTGSSLIDHENFHGKFKDSVSQFISTNVRASSLESIDLIKTIDETTIYHFKKLNEGGSEYSNIAFATVKHLHPL